MTTPERTWRRIVRDWILGEEQPILPLELPLEVTATPAAVVVPPPLPAVIVSLKTGQSIKGVLLDQRPDALILRAAAVATIEPNGGVGWNALDGDVVIPVENLDFWQSGLDAAILDSLEDRKTRRRAS